MRKLFAGLGGLVALAVILVGVPWILIAAAGNPIPTGEQLHAVVTMTPDYGHVILLTKILPMIGWLAWAFFAIPMLIELGAAVAGRTTRKRIRAFRGQQQMAAAIIAAVILMFSGTAALAGPAAPAHADTPPAPVTVAAASLHSSPAAPAPAEAERATPAEPATSSPAPAAQKKQTHDVTHTVVAGDNLWDLAEHYYGDGTRDIDIYKANRGHIQHDGRALTDPDLIIPSWKLTIPDVPVTTPAPAPKPAPAPAPAPDTASAPTTTTHSDATAPTQAGTDAATPTRAQHGATGASSDNADHTSQTTTPQTRPEPDSGLDLTIPLSTAGGIAGLLAAGLLLTLGRRRLRQRRRRHPGERIAMPGPAAADLELELRMVEDPVGVEDIDNALRCLQVWAEDTGSRLPELLAVRLADDEVALYLAGPADLPAPFESVHPDKTAWVVRPGRAQKPARDALCPYPALTTIGTDAAGGVLLLDLEQVGSLTVTGDTDTARGILTALAVELAEAPWSDQIQVTLVGLPAGLARDLNRFRVSHVDDVDALLRNLRHDLEERRAAFDSYGVTDVHDARTMATDLEAWAPHIVILGQAPDEQAAAELAGLVAQMPRLGIATVAASSSEPAAGSCAIVVGEEGAAEYRSAAMPPLPFSPQILAGHELELIQELLATTDHEAHPVDLAHEQPAPEAGTEPEPVPEPVAPAVVEDTEEAVEPAASVPAEPPAAVPAPAAALEEEETPSRTPEEPAAQTAGEQIPDWPAPYVRLLGPVDARGIADQDAMPGRGVELISYLLLQDGPVDGPRLRAAFWPDTANAANNQRGLAKKVRLALGHTPDGELLLPENVNHQGYTIHPAVRSDWDDFRDLIGDDLTRTSNANLIAAIRLVRGRPFEGVPRRWWQWRAPAEEEMIAAVLDAATELASRALNAGDTDQARRAARIAETTDPLNESGWRLELRAALHSGDADEFARIVDAMWDRLAGDDTDYQLDDETQHLIDTAGQRLQHA